MARASFDPVTLEILWTRVIGIVDEASAAFVRTSYSTLVREAHDFAIILADPEGNSLAQSSVSIPSFIGTLPATVKQLLKLFPVETLRPGDVLVTNDPWLGTGHLPDISIAMPIFDKGRVIALAAVTSHMPDIGGRLWNAGIRELYEEGLQIPTLKLIDAGKPNQTAIEFIRKNVRVPEQTMGDVWGEITACRKIEERLIELIRETGVDIVELGRQIRGRSEKAMQSAIQALPDGDYHARVENNPGFDEPIVAQAKITIRGGSMIIDLAGSSPQMQRAVNSVPNYTFAYASFGVKAVLSPDIPNNEGSTRPVTVTAPLGSIFNPRPPAPCTTRAMAGQLLPPCVMGALAEAIPEQVLAQPGSPTCCFNVSGVHDARAYALISFVSGGMGAGAGWNGLAPMSFPSNVANSPMEVMEEQAPIRIVTREMREGSGGKGRHRGGNGQRIVFDMIGDSPATASFLMNRVDRPALGLNGGKPGATGRVRINGREINPADHQVLKPGDRVIMETPAGGGFGRPEPARSGR